MTQNQKGIIHPFLLLFVIIAGIGVIVFLLVSSTAPFSTGLGSLFTKNASQAATQQIYHQYTIGGSTLPLDYQIYGGVVATNGQKMAVADRQHNRVLIYNTIPTSASAVPDVVIGQVDFSHVAANQGGAVGPNTLRLSGTYGSAGVLFVGNKLIIADGDNNRILIYNSIPTTNNASADIVIGQADFTHNSSNPLGVPAQNTLSGPGSIASDGIKLIVSDYANSRVLIFNSIPITNNASANVVIGQPDFTHNAENQGLNSPAPNTLVSPWSIASDGTRLFLGDGNSNSRLQIYNSIPTTNNAPADDSLSGYWFNQPLYHYNGFLYASPPNSSFGMGVYGATNPSPTATSTSSPTSSATPVPSCPKGSLGDIDCNGKIDIFDYNTLLTNFGK